MSSVPVDASDWTWVLDDDAPLGVCGCLTFVRRASERQVLAGFAMDADTARLMTADEVRLDPVLSSASYPEPGPFWVRVARVGDWAVGIEWMQTKGDAENVAKGLSIWGVPRILDSDSRIERICSCQRSAASSARSSRLRLCSW